MFQVGPVQFPPVSSFTPSCFGLTCAFTDASTDPDSTIAGWSWSFGDGSTSSEQSPSHAFTADGTYTVSLTVTDSQGLTSTSSQSISVAGIPPQASFEVTCESLLCMFLDTSTDPDGTIGGWVWTFGDGYGASLQNPVHTFVAAGTWTVMLTVTDDQGKTSTTAVQVTVTEPPPPPVITLSATGDRIKGVRTVNLAWAGAPGAQLDLYRNGVILVTTDNDGVHLDTVDRAGTHNYRACLPGSAICSNISSVTFQH